MLGFWVVLVQTLKSFGIGATLLVKDGYALWKRGLRSSELTFSDAVFSSSVRWDLMVGVPLTLWYLVPVVGNSVLILAYLFPPILPLCWRSPYLRAKLLKESEARALGAIVPSPLHPDFVSALFPRYFAWPSRLAPSWLKERLVVWHWSVIKYQDSFLRNLNVMDVPHDVLELWAEMRAIPVVGETDISTVPHDLPKNGRGVPLIPGKEREDALRQQLIAWQKRSSALPSALDTEKYCISMHTAHHQ